MAKVKIKAIVKAITLNYPNSIGLMKINVNNNNNFSTFIFCFKKKSDKLKPYVKL